MATTYYAPKTPKQTPKPIKTTQPKPIAPQRDIGIEYINAVRAGDVQKALRLEGERNQKISANKMTGVRSNEQLLRDAGLSTSYANQYGDKFVKDVYDALNSPLPMPTDNSAAIAAAIRAKVDRYKSEANRKISDAPTLYQPLRDQAYVTNAQSQRASDEQLAYQGLMQSGDNITASSNRNAVLSGEIGKANRDQQNYINQLQDGIRQAEFEGDLELADALQQEANRIYEATRQNELQRRADIIRAAEFGRAAMSDDRAYNRNVLESDRAYNRQVERDATEDQRYADETNYKRQMDEYEKEFQRQQAEIENSFRNRQLTEQQRQNALDNAFRDKQFKQNALESERAFKLQEQKYNEPEDPTRTEQSNADFADDYSTLKSMSVNNAMAAMNSKWNELIAKYGPEGAARLWNEVLYDAIQKDQAKKR